MPRIQSMSLWFQWVLVDFSMLILKTILSNKNSGNIWFSTSLQLTLKDTNMCPKILNAWIYLCFYSHCHISNNRQNRGTKYIHWWTKEDPLMYGDKNNITIIIPNDAVNAWLWLLHMKYQLGIDSVIVYISIYFLLLLCKSDLTLSIPTKSYIFYKDDWIWISRLLKFSILIYFSRLPLE